MGPHGRSGSTADQWCLARELGRSRRRSTISAIQLDNADVITFHSYAAPAEFEGRIAELAPLQRPILCTEYLARSQGSTVEGILPIAKRHNVGAFNWGLVAGKTQTYLPWDSWDHPTARPRRCGFTTCYTPTAGRIGTAKFKRFGS